jgi:hypothetical protein
MLDAMRTLLWRRWVVANAVGELIGLGLTFLVGFGAFAVLGELDGLGPTLGLGALMVATGAIEGTVVGLAQWQALQSRAPAQRTAQFAAQQTAQPPALSGIPRRVWWSATLRGALIAWFLGALPSILINIAGDPAGGAAEPMPEPSLTTVLLLAAGMGAVLGVVLALPQWAVLRRHVVRAGLWIPANSLAWALGMPLIFAGVNAAQATSSVVVALATIAIALILSGAVVGAVHGVVLVWLAEWTELGEAVRS